MFRIMLLAHTLHVEMHNFIIRTHSIKSFCTSCTFFLHTNSTPFAQAFLYTFVHTFAHSPLFCTIIVHTICILFIFFAQIMVNSCAISDRLNNEQFKKSILGHRTYQVTVFTQTWHLKDSVFFRFFSGLFPD